jgi:selenocysteine-specific elongation factor
MLAGAGGIDIVMLVIAAGESIKPQTREHFAICRLLGIRHGIIALTKADLVDSDILELTRMEIEEFVTGSFLQNAPVIAVSAKTGQGLDDLRAALRTAATEVPEKNAQGTFRLPIDRSFTMRGFGAIVTGTLVSGEIRPEQEVMLYPEGRRLRVRGVQVHGASASSAVAGQRTAINLAGIEAHQITRGMVLAAPDCFGAVREFACVLEALPGAPPIKHRAPVHLHAGTAEIEAEVRLFRGESALPPGGTTYARLVLREETLLLPHDRFIIRRFSPVTTIGGGMVLDIGPPRSRKPNQIKERLQKIEHAETAEWLHLLIQESGTGVTPAELIARTGLTQREIETAVRGNKSILTLPGWLVERNSVDLLREALIAKTREYHRQNPLLPGIPKSSLCEGVPAPLMDTLLAHPELAVDGDIIRHRGHRVVLQQQEEQARAAIESAFEKAGLAVPSVPDVLARSGVESARARTLLQFLIREGHLVRISEELVFHRTALDRLRQDLASIKGTILTVPGFKERTGISRKYAIPLLEYLDREKVTRREGDQRIVL